MYKGLETLYIYVLTLQHQLCSHPVLWQIVPFGIMFNVGIINIRFVADKVNLMSAQKQNQQGEKQKIIFKILQKFCKLLFQNQFMFLVDLKLLMRLIMQITFLTVSFFSTNKIQCCSNQIL